MSLLDAAGVVTGDIWCSGAFSFESPLKDLLDSGEYTLEQLLAEDELLQELRGVHPQLIELFSTEKAVTALVKYVTLPPGGTPPAYTVGAGYPPLPASTSMVSEPLDESSDEKDKDGNEGETTERKAGEANEAPSGTDDNGAPKLETQEEKDTVFIRYPYMACEVICCENNDILDTLVYGFVPDSTTSSDDEPKEETSEKEHGEAKSDSRRPILDLLFAMLYDTKAGEIDDYRAGYFDKILSVLFRKRPQALADHINQGGGRGQVPLMQAMFKHLYSHSIMQIVQRLLLPQPPIPPKEDDEEKEGEDIYTDALVGADVDGFESFRCTWSESDESLKLLLDCLIEKSQFPEIEEDEELRLSLYQNASEVLITIIQNSPLTSPTLHALTTDPVLERLIHAATTIEVGGRFGPHDSRLTCTMNVLESLILQLGGYGSVGTIMYPEEEEGSDQGESDEPEKFGASEDGESSGAPGKTRQELATSNTLISHLPVMLSNLCDLLQYPEAEDWTSPMQFSKAEPHKILGSSRLRIVRLLESLVLLGDPNVDSQLCDSNCLEICLDLFWKFQWCSMLHQSVANLLVHVFEGANARAELQSYFLVKCNLLGRLMDSFWEGAEAAKSNKEVDQDEPPPSSVDGKIGSSAGEEAAPVSDEDVAVAPDTSEEVAGTGSAEKEGENSDSLTLENRPPDLPAQSFRLGYMGHVIIICQALVHACSNEAGDPSVGGTASDGKGELGEYVARHNEESNDDEGGALQDTPEQGRAADSVITDETPANTLILAQLVESHSLRKKWEDFVQSTLASETAIQSTPLGGFPGPSLGMDPLHLHRPGLADDDEYDDEDGAAPPLPPRGLLVGGDVIDMDDNDLDVAASMMAGLTMGRSEEGGRNNQDLLSGIPQQSGDAPQPGGYMFDDPLGDGRFGRFDGDDDDESSDEESELSGNTGDSGGAVVEGVSGSADAAPEAPVMDLFAGNFEAFDGGKAEGADQQGADWSDFANFDNAFEGTNGPPPEAEDPFKTGPTNGNIDEIFGDVKDHADLLEVDPAAEAVASKIRSSEEDSSSDEEDPVLGQEETPENS